MEMDKAAPLTMFVQTDTTGFRELVQRLTGLSPHGVDCQLPSPRSCNEEAAPRVTGFRKAASKLYERRRYIMSKLEVTKPGLKSKPGPAILQHHKAGFYSTELVFSPTGTVNFSFIASPFGTPSKAFSNLSIKEETSEEAPKEACDIDREEEEKAIKDRRFYLHSSHRCRQGNAEPELLHLFPLVSPKTIS